MMKKPFECNYCPSYFLQNAFLTLYMISVNERKKTHDSNECNTSFEKKHLNDHISATHEGIKSSPNEKVA